MWRTTKAKLQVIPSASNPMTDSSELPKSPKQASIRKAIPTRTVTKIGLRHAVAAPPAQALYHKMKIKRVAPTS